MPFHLRAAAQLTSLVLAFGTCFGADDPARQSPRDQAWHVLRSGLVEEKAPRRVDAVKALSLVTGDRTAERFALHALQDKSPDVRTAAAATLGQLHATSAIPDLKEALSDKEISVVLAATYSLFLLKEKSAYGVYYAILMRDKKSSEGMVQAQLDRLKDPKQVAELGVQEGLGFVPFGGMGYQAFKQVTKKDASPVRAAAARFLAHDPDPIAEDALIQSALADSSENVRQAALDALAERGNPACVERLRKNLADDKSAVRYRTAAAILHLTTPRRGARVQKRKSPK
jgi:HEAT repeat protein